MASNLEEANKSFMKKILRSYFDPIYIQEFKLPKYNGKVTVMNGPASTILARSGKFDKMEHLKRADLFARAAVAAEKKYSKALDVATMETFGRKFEFTDYKISAIGREEFSEKRKDQLRSLAHSVTIFKTLSRAHEDAAKIQNRYKLTYASNPAPDVKYPDIAFIDSFLRYWTGTGYTHHTDKTIGRIQRFIKKVKNHTPRSREIMLNKLKGMRRSVAEKYHGPGQYAKEANYKRLVKLDQEIDLINKYFM